jgi:GDP-L-fucose synthase
MEKDSKIYVAGHRGLVGSIVLAMLKEKGYKNIVTRTSAELDLKRQADTEAFFESERPEHVFLCASKVGGILANSTFTAEFIYDNILIAANVINSAWKTGAKKLLNLGSSCIYPRHCGQPMKEEYLLGGYLEPTNEPYAVAKISAIKLCRYYNEQYGTDFISAMPTNLFGPGDNFNLVTSHVLPALMRKFHLAKMLSGGHHDEIRKDIELFGNPPDNKNSLEEHLSGFGITADAVNLWGSGEPYREFLYNEDLADACIFLMENYSYKDIGELINVGVGEDLKIKEIADIVKKVVGFEGETAHDLSKPDGMPRKLLDVSRLKSLGWEAKTSLEEGVRLTYKWYLERISSLT